MITIKDDELIAYIEEMLEVAFNIADDNRHQAKNDYDKALKNRDNWWKTPISGITPKDVMEKSIELDDKCFEAENVLNNEHGRYLVAEQMLDDFRKLIIIEKSQSLNIVERGTITME